MNVSNICRCMTRDIEASDVRRAQLFRQKAPMPAPADGVEQSWSAGSIHSPNEQNRHETTTHSSSSFLAVVGIPDGGSRCAYGRPRRLLSQRDPLPGTG